MIFISVDLREWVSRQAPFLISAPDPQGKGKVLIMKKNADPKQEDPRKENEQNLEFNPQAQGPKKGTTQGDRDRQQGAASTLKQDKARMSKPDPNATQGGSRGRRGTSDNIDH